MNVPVSDRNTFVPDEVTTRIMVLVADGVSLTTLSGTLDPLQHANTMLGRDRFELQLVSLRDKDPTTKAGVCVSCHARSAEVLVHCDISQRPDHVILCCGQLLAEHDTGLMRGFIQRLARSGVPFFALGAACAVVAAAGLFKGDTCAAHWKTIAPLGESFPDIKFENVLFAHDGKVTSCAGELAAFDLIGGSSKISVGRGSAARFATTFWPAAGAAGRPCNCSTVMR